MKRLFQSLGILIFATALSAAAWWMPPEQHELRFAAVAGAFLLCVWVVYLCAPLVARWEWFDRLPFWGFRLTREGGLYLCILLAVAFLALVSGNNLVYLVLSCLLATMVLSGLVSRLNLAGLQLDISFPRHIFARQPAPARVTLRNLKRWMPSFSVWVGAGSRGEPAEAGMIEGFYCPMITGGSQAVATLPIRFTRRGRFRQQSFWLRSGFPLSLVERRTRLAVEREVLVYPAVDGPPDLFSFLAETGRSSTLPARGESHDLYRLRPALAGDSARFIDWKASSRAGEEMVREFHRHQRPDIEILLQRPLVTDGNTRARFEELVALCAGTVWRLHGQRVRLRYLCDELRLDVPPNSSAVYEVLRHLALVEPRLGGNDEPVPAAASPYESAPARRLRFVLDPQSGQPALQLMGDCPVFPPHE